jgi:hypothetical protein
VVFTLHCVAVAGGPLAVRPHRSQKEAVQLLLVA